ncbi:MAG: Arm DNA-binding domain-containing protein [Acetobacteraceae bacterium]|jgi:hypothetical protein
MPQTKVGKLTALAVNRMGKPGKFGDGAGLYLVVTRGGTKSWAFRFTRAGQAREMGLGAVHTVWLCYRNLAQ